MIDAYMIFRYSAPYSYILLVFGLLGLLAPIAILLGARVPRAAVWAMPGLCTAVAVLGYLLTASKLSSIVDAPGIDRSQAARIEAEGTSESFALFIFACGVCSLLLALTSVLLSIRAWRRVDAARWGRGVIAGGIGGLLSFAFLGVRTALAGRFGYTVWSSDSTITPALLPSLFGSIAALVAGAALGGQPRPNEEQNVGGDAIHAAMAGIVAVALPLVGAQLKHWSTVFGAQSGESVDASDRMRIMYQGVDEAHGLFIGNVVYMLPIVVAFAVALLPQLGAVARGLTEGIPAYLAGLAILVSFSATPTLIVPRAQARLEAKRQMAWPAGFRPVTIDTSADDFSDPVLFVTKSDGPLEDPAACDAIVRKAKFRKPEPYRAIPAAIAVEEDRSAKSLYCLAESVRDSLHVHEGKQAVAFVVNVNNEFFTRKGQVRATTQGAVRVGTFKTKPRIPPDKIIYFASENDMTAGRLLPLMAKKASRDLPVLLP